jgi:beta-lactamase class C
MKFYLGLVVLLSTNLSCSVSQDLRGEAFAAELEKPPAALQRSLNEFERKANRLQGGAIAVLHEGRVIYKYTFGHLRRKQGEVTSDTLFPLASCSKSVSSALVAYLVKQKKLSFDASLVGLFPRLDPRVQLGHLLSHSSGYSDKMGNKDIEAGKARDVVMGDALSIPAAYVPGTHYAYSNIFYSLLEELVAARTGASYAQNMREFLAMAEIKNAGICGVDPKQTVAYPHSQIVGSTKLKSRDLPPYYPKTACSAAGIFLSIDDFAQFAKLMSGYLTEVLNEKELAPLFEARVPAPEILRNWPIHWPYLPRELTSQYGYGWRILTHQGEAEKKLIFHSGFINGVRSFIGLVPDRHYSVVILTNQDATFAVEEGVGFWKKIIELPNDELKQINIFK